MFVCRRATGVSRLAAAASAEHFGHRLGRVPLGLGRPRPDEDPDPARFGIQRGKTAGHLGPRRIRLDEAATAPPEQRMQAVPGGPRGQVERNEPRRPALEALERLAVGHPLDRPQRHDRSAVILSGPFRFLRQVLELAGDPPAQVVTQLAVEQRAEDGGAVGEAQDRDLGPPPARRQQERARENDPGPHGSDPSAVSSASRPRRRPAAARARPGSARRSPSRPSRPACRRSHRSSPSAHLPRRNRRRRPPAETAHPA